MVTFIFRICKCNFSILLHCIILLPAQTAYHTIQKDRYVFKKNIIINNKNTKKATKPKYNLSSEMFTCSEVLQHIYTKDAPFGIFKCKQSHFC